jgi:hypothetical protein
VAAGEMFRRENVRGTIAQYAGGDAQRRAREAKIFTAAANLDRCPHGQQLDRLARM